MNFSTITKGLAIGLAVLALLMLIIDSVWASLAVAFTIFAVAIHILTWKRTKRPISQAPSPERMVSVEDVQDKGFENLYNQIHKDAWKSMILGERVRRNL